MTVNIEIEDRIVPVTLDWENHHWESAQEFAESDFPVPFAHEGRRYELYSDQTFAEVE